MKCHHTLFKTITILFLSILISACQTDVSNQILSSQESQVKLRSYQSRVFDTQDKTKILRTVISTLQDLGFVIEKADDNLGSITGVKFVNHQPFRMSVTVRSHGKTQMMVRANAQFQAKAVEEPMIYQDFFSTLSKSMFLTAHEVN